MTKTELTRIIADRSGIETAAVKLILDEFAEQVCDCLTRGENNSLKWIDESAARAATKPDR